jgi:hypothetical protein
VDDGSLAFRRDHHVAQPEQLARNRRRAGLGKRDRKTLAPVAN